MENNSLTIYAGQATRSIGPLRHCKLPLRYGWRIVVAVVIAGYCSIPAFAQEESQPDSFKISGKTMGPIVYNVVIAQPGASKDQKAIKATIQATLDRVDDLMSTYQPDSDVSRFNSAQSTDWQTVDAATANVVNRAIEISQQTGGAFDITVAPAVNAWQFGPNKSSNFKPPTTAELAKLRERVGFRFLEVRLDPPAIRKFNPAVSIDLSAIAKGYAVDQVAQALGDQGFSNYMVEVGGEVFARGERAQGGKWRIGIESPKKLVRTYEKIAELSGQAMATSGDYRIFRMLDGKRYSHIIDPTTCAPVEHSLATACVVAPDCLTADAFATAVSVLGVEKGAELCRQQSLELFTVERNNGLESDLIETASTGFPLLDPADNSDRASEQKPPGQSIWPTFIGAMIVFSLAILGMAVGAIFGNKPVQGSCGGLSSMTNDDGEASCTVCARPTTDCVETKTD
jgi:thiamine biosynthesis lipoprotein